MTLPKGIEVIELIKKDRGIGPVRAEAYALGMYTLSSERDMEETRRRILARWARGIDRGMLREYKVLYSALWQLLSRVGEA